MPGLFLKNADLTPRRDTFDPIEIASRDEIAAHHLIDETRLLDRLLERAVFSEDERRRSADIARSPLDEIPGIGGKRKRALLLHFGSARGVAAAGLTDLESVAGINKTVAKKVYDHFHGQS